MIAIVTRGDCLVNDYPRPRGQEAVHRLDMVGHFSFCTPFEVNVITSVLFYHIVLKLWFSPKTIDFNCDTRLLSS